MFLCTFSKENAISAWVRLSSQQLFNWEKILIFSILGDNISSWLVNLRGHVMLQLVCSESKYITWLSVCECDGLWSETVHVSASLLVLAHSDLQRLPEGRSSHKSCSGCEGPEMIFPARFLSQEVCESWSTPVIFSAVLKVSMADIWICWVGSLWGSSWSHIHSFMRVCTRGPAVCMQNCHCLVWGHGPSKDLHPKAKSSS